jgi:hypothetical protein
MKTYLHVKSKDDLIEIHLKDDEGLLEILQFTKENIKILIKLLKIVTKENKEATFD